MNNSRRVVDWAQPLVCVQDKGHALEALPARRLGILHSSHRPHVIAVQEPQGEVVLWVDATGAEYTGQSPHLGVMNRADIVVPEVPRAARFVAFEWLRKYALDHPEVPEAGDALLAWKQEAEAAKAAADDPTYCPRCESRHIVKVAPHETWRCAYGHKFVTKEAESNPEWFHAHADLGRALIAYDALAARLAAVERILNDYWQGVGPTDIVPALRKLFPVPATTDRSTPPAPACPNVGCKIEGPHEHEITGPWDATTNSADAGRKEE